MKWMLIITVCLASNGQNQCVIFVPVQEYYSYQECSMNSMLIKPDIEEMGGEFRMTCLPYIDYEPKEGSKI